ncbi:hypothetical protein EYS14_14845 [Alteromonadaceae bacterium M269]|nr:hypothetical protein EYS14_14845 [Alteromonadaceae bacterium M269]
MRKVSKQCIVASTLFISALAYSIPNAPTNEQDSQDVNNKENVEVIEVYGQRSLDFFRSELRLAEDSFNELYNSLTDNEDYYTECAVNLSSAYKIKVRECHVKFELDIRAEAAQIGRNCGSRSFSCATPSPAAINKRIAKRRLEYVQDLKKHVESNPELMALLIKVQEAKTNLEKAHLARWGKLSEHYYTASKTEDAQTHTEDNQ